MRLSAIRLGVRAVPAVKAADLGLDKGFNKFYNFYTVQGRYGAFAGCILLIWGTIKLSIWKYNRPFVAEKKKEEQAKRDLFERTVRAWEANGKKFD